MTALTAPVVAPRARWVGPALRVAAVVAAACAFVGAAAVSRAVLADRLAVRRAGESAVTVDGSVVLDKPAGWLRGDLAEAPAAERALLVGSRAELPPGLVLTRGATVLLVVAVPAAADAIGVLPARLGAIRVIEQSAAETPFGPGRRVRAAAPGREIMATYISGAGRVVVVAAVAPRLDGEALAAQERIAASLRAEDS